MNADLLRVLSMILYAILLGQTAAIVWLYFKVLRVRGSRRGLLPTHVIILGTSVILLATEAVWENISRLHESFSWYAVVNPLIFAFVVFGLHLVMRYEHLRYVRSRVNA